MWVRGEKGSGVLHDVSLGPMRFMREEPVRKERRAGRVRQEAFPNPTLIHHERAVCAP